MKKIIYTLILGLTLASCASKKAASDASSALVAPDNITAMKFVQRVADQKVSAKNIVADMTFTGTFGSKDITLPGKVRMRRDEVVRLELNVPILGSQVGLLEFTPNYVLVIDRMHKQYIKADYNQLDFLRNNGLNFYSLQALFWNQLLLPGTSRVSEGDLEQFSADLSNVSVVPVTFEKGGMHYQWTTDRSTGRITKTTVDYKSTSHGSSTLTWNYDNFRSLGSKQFPATQEFSFTTTASNKVKQNSIRLEMKELKQNDSWEAQTTPSSRYKQMSAEDIFGQLMKM